MRAQRLIADNAPFRALAVPAILALGVATSLTGCGGDATSSGGGGSAASGTSTGGGAEGGASSTGQGATTGSASGPTGGGANGGAAGTGGAIGTGGQGGGGGGDNVVVRPLGSVTVTNPSPMCPPGAGMNASCKQVTVTCPAAPDISATLAIYDPPGSPKGTIVSHAGGDGTSFFSSGEAGKGFDKDFTEAGFRYVQIEWASPGWASTGNIKAAACRPATLFQWIFDNLHTGAHNKGFCGISSSGGTAAVTFSLAAYGLKDDFDYLVMAAGPTPSRIDYGCDPSLYSGPPRDLCPLLPNAPYAYGMGVTNIADGWTGTHTCGHTSGGADQATWLDDSILSSGDDLSYPKTGMSFWFCTTTPNESTGSATFFIEKAEPKAPADVNCYSGTCTDEYVFSDPTAHAKALSEMKTNCVPNH